MIQEFYQQGRFFPSIVNVFYNLSPAFFVVVKSQFFLFSPRKFAGQYMHQAECDGKSNNALFHDPMGMENRKN